MRGEGVRNFKGEGVLDFNSQQEVTRPGKILFFSRKGKKVVQEKEEERGEEEIERERVGGRLSKIL